MQTGGAGLELTHDGFLQIRTGADPGIGAGQRCSLVDFARAFCTSPHRARIFDGYLNFRRELHRIGIHRGTQWLNGSYASPKETPSDIDVVSFLLAGDVTEPPGAVTTSPDATVDSKQAYSVDSYVVCLDLIAPDALVEISVYWYELWSQRKTPPGSRKGFAVVDLAEPLTEAESHVRSILGPRRGADR